MCGAGLRSMLHRICVSTPQESTSEKPHKNLCFERFPSPSLFCWGFSSLTHDDHHSTIPVEKCTKRSNLKFCFPASTTLPPPTAAAALCHSPATTTHINMLRFSFLVTSVPPSKSRRSAPTTEHYSRRRWSSTPHPDSTLLRDPRTKVENEIAHTLSGRKISRRQNPLFPTSHTPR